MVDFSSLAGGCR